MIVNIAAQPRQTGKKSMLTVMRSKGMIPGVLYGPGMDAVSIVVNNAEFTRCYKKSFAELTFFEVELEGKKYHTILKDKLIHPVSRNFLHLDFMVVDATSMMEFDLPVHFEGEAIGTKEGGFLDIIQRNVKISCPADNVPEDLRLNVSNLKVGDSLHVRDLPKGNWTFKDHDDVTLVVVHPKKAESPQPAAVTTEEPKKED